MVSSLIIKIRRRKESDIHIKFFIEGTYENLKQLKYHYYYHLCRENKKYDNKDNDDSCQYIKSHDDDILCMISNDIKSFYKCQENNCNQSFDSLIKVNNYISVMMMMIMVMMKMMIILMMTTFVNIIMMMVMMIMKIIIFILMISIILIC